MLLIEEGTTNLLSANTANGVNGLFSNNSAYSTNDYLTNFGYSDNYSVRGTQVQGGYPSYGFYTSAYAITPNLVYTASCYVYTTLPSKKFKVGINWYDSNSAFISTTYGTATTILSGIWTRIVVTATAPSNSAKALVLVVESGTTSNVGDIYYFDSIMLEQKSYATSFVVGTRPAGITLSSNTVNTGDTFLLSVYVTEQTAVWGDPFVKTWTDMNNLDWNRVIHKDF